MKKETKSKDAPMGFEYKLIHGIRRYRVVSLTDAEKKQYRHLPDEGGEGVEVE